MKRKNLRKISDSDKGVHGKSLHPNVAIAHRYTKAIQDEIKRMVAETRRDLSVMFEAPGYALDDDDLDQVKDGNPASRARIIINRLLRKYKGRFDALAKAATAKMIIDTVKHVDVSTTISLREIYKNFELQDFWSDRLREIIQASTQEAAQLIKTIPHHFLAQVQGETMRAITSGRGMKALEPFLAKQYGENMRKAKNVARDQCRKAYNDMAAQRMQDAGVTQFVWHHSHAPKVPRKQHEEWDGKVFRFDDLPIDEKFGPVIPGRAINCKCFMAPVLNFGE